MKKFYTSLLLAILTLVGIQTSQAQTIYEAVGFADGEYLTEITPGQKVCIQSANSSSTAVLDTALSGSLSAAISDACVWEFQVANADNGQYYIYNAASGKYLYVGVDASGYAFLGLTASKNKAEDFYVRESQYYASADDFPSDGDWATFTQDANEGSFTITYSSWGTPSSSYHYKLAQTSSYFSATSSSTWYLYPVQEASGLTKLYAVFNQYFPSGANDEFTAGTAPGNIPQDLYDALEAAYNTAADLINNESTDVEACNAAAEAIITAYQNAKAGVILFSEGYYFVVNHVNNYSAMYENNGGVWFNSDSQWSVPDVAGEDDMPYIWKLTKASDGRNDFYFQNYVTGNYINFINGYSATVPTSTTAEQSYTIQEFPGLNGYWGLTLTSSTSFNLHANTSGTKNVVYWSLSHNNSAWSLYKIDDEDIAALNNILEKKKVSDALSALYDEAEAYYKQGFTYTSNATEDSEYASTGLVTSVSQVWSNAPEQSEGYIQNSVDGDVTTFFHSAWNASPTPFNDAIYHNFCADLGEAVDTLSVKITKRMSGTPTTYANDAPGHVHFYATNDTTGFAAGDYSKWVDQGEMDFSYPYSATVNGTTYPNETGINTCIFDGKYRYVRLDVESRLNGTTKGWFNFGEIQFYKASYDKENSIVEYVEPTLRQNLIDAMAYAKEVIDEGSATQEVVDSLTSALNAYKAGYPDPAELQSALAEMQVYLAYAQESDAIGDYQEGSKETLSAVLTDLTNKIEDIRTIDQIKEATATLESAIAQFDASRNIPEDGKIYYIRSNYANSASIYNNYLGVYGNRLKTRLCFGGYSSESGEDANVPNHLDYMWRAEKQADGGLAFRNLASGFYIGDVNFGNNTGVSIYQSKEPHSITLGRAPQATTFYLITPSGGYITYYPSTAKTMYAYSSPYGYSFVKITEVNTADWGGSYYLNVTAGQLTPYTLPFAITGEIGEGTLYKVSGVRQTESDTTLELTAYTADDVIPAGTPFIFVTSDGASSVNFFPTATSLDDIEYNFEPLSSPAGFNGVLVETNLSKGFNMFQSGSIIAATSEDVTTANSAYLSGELPIVTEAGDLSVSMPGMPTLTTAIDAANLLKPATSSAIYDLQGRRVSKMNHGLYIVNGKKVYVK